MSKYASLARRVNQVLGRQALGTMELVNTSDAESDADFVFRFVMDDEPDNAPCNTDQYNVME